MISVNASPIEQSWTCVRSHSMASTVPATDQREEDEIVVDIERRIVSEANIDPESDSDDGKTHEDGVRRDHRRRGRRKPHDCGCNTQVNSARSEGVTW